jgi:hypothetical protein
MEAKIPLTPHGIEEKGISLLVERLTNDGHNVQRLRGGTFDLEIDGRQAEAKSKGDRFEHLDFISFTENQWAAVKEQDFDIYIVSGIKEGTPEFRKLSSCDLRHKSPRVVTSYECDKRAVKDIVETI